MRARVVVFDVGNVLLRWDPALVYPELSPAQCAEFFDEVGFFAWNLEQDRGRSWQEGVAHLSALYPHRAELIARFDERWEDSLPGAIEGSVAILEQLAAKGVPLYAITNFSHETWLRTRDRFPFLYRHFRDVVVSGRERLVKPELAIYQTLLSRNMLEPGACLFIDDSPINVSGARAAGMKAVHFTSAAQLHEDLNKEGLL
ncbi:MAG: HAD family phosphatase [Neomegalonema sp.]|nr:HAD family phosphatase [Neomegalonema sp.]